MTNEQQHAAIKARAIEMLRAGTVSVYSWEQLLKFVRKGSRGKTKLGIAVTVTLLHARVEVATPEFVRDVWHKSDDLNCFKAQREIMTAD